MPLQEQQAEAWVKKHIVKLRRQYGLGHWKIHLYYETDTANRASGECKADPRYENAAINMNLARIDSLKEFEDVLRHEFLHIVHAPFQMYRWAVNEALDVLPMMDSTRAALESVYVDSMELTVRNMERMEAELRQ